VITLVSQLDRRRELRCSSDDVIRWKRPGRIEDHKGWTLDGSPSGIGFLALAEAAPEVGDRIHIRKLEGDTWTTLDRTVRVARADPTANNEFVVVGCAIL
jgi:hypothetical protein